ncbi:MAG: hypothetical protein AB8G18_02145 [Gammaproteobacteria bacterium]
MKKTIYENRMSGKRRFWLTLLAITILPLAYCSIAPPPATIDYPYPQGSPGTAELLDEFWEIFQRQDVDAVVSTACLPEASHPIKGVATTAEQHYDIKSRFPPPRNDSERLRNIVCQFEDFLQKNPDDPTAQVVLSAMYMWRVQSMVHPPMTEFDLHEARHHAANSVKAGSPMAGGFEASPTWILGFLNNDTALKKAAYDQLVRDTLEFPTFHGYIEGAVLSGMLNPDEPEPPFEYKWVAVSFMENIETCMLGDKMRGIIQLPEGLKMSKLTFNAMAVIAKITKRGYCYNTDVSPFNMQGLYITQGDGYLKDGNYKYAKVAYENALNSPNKENYRYAHQVQMRLDDMEGMRQKFLNDSGKMGVDQHPSAMIFQAKWYCAACHQKPKKKLTH